MDENGAKQGILLESGTNEIEIMEFTIAGNTFGTVSYTHLDVYKRQNLT